MSFKNNLIKPRHYSYYFFSFFLFFLFLFFLSLLFFLFSLLCSYSSPDFFSGHNPPPTTIYQLPQILHANHNNKLTITTTTATPSFNQIPPITHNSKYKLTKHKSQISDLIGYCNPIASPCDDKSVSFPSRSTHLAKMVRGTQKNRSASWLHVVLGKRFRLDLWVCGLVGHEFEASVTWWSFSSSPATFFHGCSGSRAWRTGWGLELRWPLSLSWRSPT